MRKGQRKMSRTLARSIARENMKAAGITQMNKPKPVYSGGMAERQVKRGRIGNQKSTKSAESRKVSSGSAFAKHWREYVNADTVYKLAKRMGAG